MKSIMCFSFVLATLSVYSQSSNAKIFFIRNTGPSLSKFKVFIDNNVVCKLPQRRYSIHEVSPGKHSFTVQQSGMKARKRARKKAVTVDCEAGKTYYVNLVLREQYRRRSQHLYCEEITENSWGKLYADLPVQENCRVK